MSGCLGSGDYVLRRKTVPDPPRRFRLVRNVDHTGVSGTGVVAYGIMWSDGSLTLRWNGTYASLVVWNNVDHMLAVHGHDGATAIEWIDAPPDEEDFVSLHQWETNGGTPAA